MHIMRCEHKTPLYTTDLRITFSSRHSGTHGLQLLLSLNNASVWLNIMFIQRYGKYHVVYLIMSSSFPKLLTVSWIRKAWITSCRAKSREQSLKELIIHSFISDNCPKEFGCVKYFNGVQSQVPFGLHPPTFLARINLEHSHNTHLCVRVPFARKNLRELPW